jgi:hypothetical protein
MTNQILNILFLSFPIAVIALVYSCILTDGGMILSKIHGYCVTHLSPSIHKPMLTCDKCVSGQLALWLFIYLVKCDYNFFMHVYFIMQSILTTAILKAVYYAIIKQAPKPEFNFNKKIKKPAELL